MAARKKAPAKKTAAKKTRGRPAAVYSEAIATKILNLIAGGKALVAICKKAGFPCARVVYRWIDENEEFRNRYTRAREEQADFYAAQCIDIADKCRTGTKTRQTKDGTFKETGDMVDRSRLQIEVRRWYAGKLAPKKYGDKVALVGGDGEKDEPICFTLRKIEGKDKK